MNEETVNNVILLVDKLCERLSVPASKLLSALALRGYSIVTVTIGLTVLFLITAYMLYKYRKYASDIDAGPGWWIVGLPACIMMGIGALITLTDVFIWLADPEGYALLELLKMLGKG
jgi:hypothetical protein